MNTEKNRRRQIKGYLERFANAGDPESEYYLEHGSWRDKTVDKIPQHMIDISERRECYQNTLRIILEHMEDDEITYVEGVAMADESPMVVKHAWIGIEGQVADPTWGIHKDSTYFGVEVDKHDVAERTLKRDWIGPCIPVAKRTY